MNLRKTAFAFAALLLCGTGSAAPTTLATLTLGTNRAGMGVDPLSALTIALLMAQPQQVF